MVIVLSYSRISLSLSSCLHKSAECSVPVYKAGVQKHWWTPELDGLKQLCTDATAMWKAARKPRSREVNANRVRMPSYFKPWACESFVIVSWETHTLQQDVVSAICQHKALCSCSGRGDWKVNFFGQRRVERRNLLLGAEFSAAGAWLELVGHGASDFRQHLSQVDRTRLDQRLGKLVTESLDEPGTLAGAAPREVT